MRTNHWRIGGAAALLAACAACGGGETGGADTAAADTTAGASGLAGATSASTADASDPTRVPTGGAGVPAGFSGRTDRPSQPLTDVKYVEREGGAWEVTSGPAHILWAAGDTATGRYTARARFTQLEAPAHPEAFGLIVGGKDLEAEAQRYTYFIVRGTGEYLVRVREGAATRDVRGWTAVPAVAKQDGSGRATYDLAVRVDRDSTRFLVGDTPVFAVAAGTVPTDGLAGVRVNHNLRVELRPVALVRN